MKKLHFSFSIFLFAWVNVTASESPPKPDEITLCADKHILGRIEKVKIVDNNLTLDAKLDTGATMASLSASDIKTFKHGDKIWVQFTVYQPSTHGKNIFTKQIVRYTHILKREEEEKNEIESNTKEYSIRPVVVLPICIGNQKTSILVNLVNRTHFRYPMLLGADALKKFKALVDVSQDHLTQPGCQ